MAQDIKALIITAKFLQFCAEIFAIFGLLLFGIIYFNHYDATITRALKDPLFVAFIVIPFMPAAILAWQASKKRKQIRALLEQRGKSS